MAETGLSEVLAYLRKTCAIKAARNLSDAELMGRFVTDREEAAFSALVRRHGPMVLSVCRRVLGDCHSSEDAFQATFLVLVRRIASLSRNKPLAGWLYGVAQRIALRARTQQAGRRDRERQAADMPRTEPLDDVTWQELRAVLDEEIGRLPEKYRTPIVLCYFEGKTHDQAAHELGWPKRSLTSRLSKAREMLRERLSSRGITLTSGVLAAALAEKTAGTAVGAMLTINTVKAAMTISAGKAITGSVLSAKAIALAEETMKGMIGVKLKILAALLAVGVAVGSAGVAGYGALSTDGFVISHGPVPVVTDASDKNVATTIVQQVNDKDAEKLFGEMEKKIREAKSLKVVFEMVSDANGQELTGKGTCYFSEGNKVRIDLEARDGNKVLQVSVISDGVHLFRRQSEAPDTPAVVAPVHFSKAATGVLTRMGGFFSAVGLEPLLARDIFDIEREIAVSDFKLGGKENVGKQEAQVIEYVMIVDRFNGAKVPAKMWIDANAFVPLKRHVVLEFEGQGKATFTDLYSEFSVNAKFDDKLFELPAGVELPKPKAPKASYPIKGNPSGKENKALAPMLDRYGDALPADAVERLGPLSFRHGANVSAVACSPDGKLLASSSWTGDSRVCIWDATNGKALHRLSIPTSSSALAFSPDGKTLLTESSIIDVASGKELRKFGGTKAVHAPAVITADGKVLARVDFPANGNKTRMIFIDMASSKELRRIEWISREAPLQKGGAAYAPTPPVFAPDGKTIVAGNEDKSIRIFEVATGKEIQRLNGHEGPVNYLAFSPNGKLLASSSIGERDVLLWDAEKGVVVNRIKVDGENARVLFSPNGNLLITDFTHAVICEPLTGKELHKWRMYPFTTSFAFTPDSKTLLSASHLESGVYRWNVETGKEIEPFDAHAGAIMALHFSPDGKTLFSGGSDRKVRDWDLTTGLARERKAANAFGPTDPGLFCAMAGLSQSGKVMAVWVHDLGTTGAAKKKELELFLYDAETGKELHTLQQGVYSSDAVFSPDGKYVASQGNYKLQIWEVATGKAIAISKLEPVNSGAEVAFSPDSKSLAIRDDKTVRLFDIVTQKELRSWEHHQTTNYALVFSPDGKLLASASYTNIAVWSTDTGKQIRQMEPSKKYLRKLAFSPSGRYLAIWERAENIELWEVLSGEKVCEIHTTQGIVSSATFSPDGHILATGGGDSTILLWDLTGHATEKPKATPLAAAEIEKHWADLGGDAVRADAAIWALAFRGKENITVLKERLKPVAPANQKQVADLISELGSEQFAVRQTALAALENLGEPAEAQLRKVLKGNITLELRQRVEKVLEKRDKDPEVIRRLRAVETLEHIATAEARQLLDSLATQSPNPRVAEAAASALARLAKRS